MARAPSPTTRRLAGLFPDVYAAEDPDSVLHKLLDALGASLAEGEEDVKRMLKSHWVDYAEGAALDGLAATFGVRRRRLRNEEPESDEAFRRRLRAVVPLFTGGGTVAAVRGAVRSALGLPFDLADLELPPHAEGLRPDLEALVTVEEFSPAEERRRGTAERVEDDGGGRAQLTLELRPTTVRAATPTIEVTPTEGAARDLEISRLPTGEEDDEGRVGVRSTGELVVTEGQTLTLRRDGDGAFQAVVDGADVTAHFADLDGERPPSLPDVPRTASRWQLRAHGARYDHSDFDEDATFDPPAFSAEVRWRSLQPLTFDVHVPYLLADTVEALKDRHDFTGRVFVFEGLGHEQLKEVVDQTRAAGVLGSVHFSLSLFDRLDPDDGTRISLVHRAFEDAGAREQLRVGSLQQGTESHDATERVRIGGLYDIATFDTDHGYF